MALAQEVLVSAADGVVRIVINRPERRNALTETVMAGVGCAIRDASADRDARVIVLTATGDRAFCAGADLTPGDTPFTHDFSRNTLPFADLLRAGMASPLPIVGAINGACVAGGMGLLGICDMAIASSTARFGMPEAKIGIFPMQIVAVLRDLIPPRAMADYCFTGRLFDAHEAMSIGLVNRVVEPEALEEAVSEVARGIAAVSPVAVRRGKYALRAMRDMTFEQMIAFAETQVGPMTLTEDAREGMSAFNEKRPPVWPNR